MTEKLTVVLWGWLAKTQQTTYEQGMIVKKLIVCWKENVKMGYKQQIVIRSVLKKYNCKFDQKYPCYYIM